MSEPISLSAKRAEMTGDNRLWTPEDCLKDALEEIQNGNRKCDKIMILTLDKGEDGELFNNGYYAAGIHGSEMLALLKVTEVTVLQEMNVIPED